MIGIEPVCMKCKHFYSDSFGKRCFAFPDGIPNDIWMGENKHTKPHPDQENEIVFEKKEQ